MPKSVERINEGKANLENNRKDKWMFTSVNNKEVKEWWYANMPLFLYKKRKEGRID